jgi:AraC family transcriptional regulator of adaptative response/methylated-DNA-[protein]-cysteine methyltransferase
LKSQLIIDYQRIVETIDYVIENFKDNPSLDEIASVINLSPYHFQRLFSRWVGVSPKKFLQHIKINYAKDKLASEKLPLLHVAYDLGLSSVSRLHDLFVKVEGMTPGQFKSRGEGLEIKYSFHDTYFGKLIIGSTSIGVCYMGFVKDHALGAEKIKAKFLNATLFEGTDDIQVNALKIFNKDWTNLENISLHLCGSPFQLKVWEALLSIPMGSLSTYGGIAKNIDRPGSFRAVGNAIGDNPVAYLIPCHRVIRSNGQAGGYRWGLNRKRAMIAREALALDNT